MARFVRLHPVAFGLPILRFVLSLVSTAKALFQFSLFFSLLSTSETVGELAVDWSR